LSASVVLILVPLFVGYLIPLPSARLRSAVNKTLNGLVYLILLLLGIGLGALPDLGSRLLGLGWQVLALVMALAVANLAGLWWWSRMQPMAPPSDGRTGAGGHWRMLGDAVRTLCAVIGGVLVGLFWFRGADWTGDAAQYALMVLLLLIGCQLRNAGIPLRRVLLNRQGLGIALVVIVTSLLAGLVLIPVLGLAWSQVMALASGFGWYSLSAVVIGHTLGPLWGGAAFLNDMAREVVALVAIPALMQLRPALAVGYGGATAMDFTLPVIQRAGGLEMVPVAMASGFILSLLSPVLMAVFLSVGVS